MHSLNLLGVMFTFIACGINFISLHPRFRLITFSMVPSVTALILFMGLLVFQLQQAYAKPGLRLDVSNFIFSQTLLMTEQPSWHLAVLSAGILPVSIFSILLLDKPWARVLGAYNALAVLVCAGVLMIFTDSLPLLLVGFELLLLSSMFLLLITSKADRIGQAINEMYLWTLVGSVCLLIVIGLLSVGGITRFSDLAIAPGLDPLLSWLFLFGFAVKLPVWPCYSWLLRAHVEASVEFSILLSGLIVKFGALGMARVLEVQPSGPAVHVMASFCVIAMVEATLRLCAQRDLKRIVALTTVVEMNWVGLCLCQGGVVFTQIAALLMVAHSFATTGEFYLTELIYKRHHTRDVTQLTGLYAQTPLLWVLALVTTLTSIGFPATSLFIAKLSFLTSLASGPWILFLPFTGGLMVVLPLVFIRVWAPLWFGTSVESSSVGLRRDLTGKEAAVLLIAAGGSFTLAVMPHFFLGVV